MVIDPDRLIAEVYKRPVIWDKTHKSHRNRFVVENNWEHIEIIMKESIEQLKKKWKGLRDQFRNEIKKIPIEGRGFSSITMEECDKYTTWPPLKSLMFLKDHINPRNYSAYYKASAETTTYQQTFTEETLHNENTNENFDDTVTSAGTFQTEVELWSAKLEKMDSNQAFIAIKLINDVIFQASLGHLTLSANICCGSVSSTPPPPPSVRIEDSRPSVSQQETKQKKRKSSDAIVLKKAIAFMQQPTDDYQVFGDYIASEFRLLKLNENKTLLRRKIQKAIMEVSEIDSLEDSSNLSGSEPPCTPVSSTATK